MDAYTQLTSLPRQLREGIAVAKDVKVQPPFSSIMILGMGASGIPGNLLQSIMQGSRIPVFVNKDYVLPGHVGADTLVLAISYSGNTAETLAAYKEALKRHAKIVILTSGGKLKEYAKEHKVQSVIVPAGYQPRMAVGYLLSAVLMVLQNSHVLKGVEHDIAKAAAALENPLIQQRAQELAEKLRGVPLIYCSTRWEGVALRFRQELNENAKMFAFHHVFSELNHNEMVAMTRPQAKFYAVILRDEDDLVQVRKRMDLTKQILGKARIPVTELSIKGDNFLTKLLTTMLLGDLTSYYIAVRDKVNPLDVGVIEEFKKAMGGK